MDGREPGLYSYRSYAKFKKRQDQQESVFQTVSKTLPNMRPIGPGVLCSQPNGQHQPAEAGNLLDAVKTHRLRSLLSFGELSSCLSLSESRHRHSTSIPYRVQNSLHRDVPNAHSRQPDNQTTRQPDRPRQPSEARDERRGTRLQSQSGLTHERAVTITTITATLNPRGFRPQSGWLVRSGVDPLVCPIPLG